MEKKVVKCFYHEHPLILTENVSISDTPICYACGDSVANLEASYVCTHQNSCRNRIILHKKCGELPIQVLHPKHPQHPLHLHDYHRESVDPAWCDVCLRDLKPVLGYRCSSCDFDVDIKCERISIDMILKENRQIEHPSHPDHPLTLMRKHSFPFCCDGCGVEDVDLAYMCSTCEVWIHKSCASLPLVLPLNPQYHHHPLSLAFSFPSKYHEYIFDCDVCLKRLDQTSWVYFCGDCRFFAHIRCVVGSNVRQVKDDDGSDVKDMPATMKKPEGLLPHFEIGMPTLPPKMIEGNISKWLKKEVDNVSTGEVLCEVETDKATIEMECMEEGYLAKILRGDGSSGIKVCEVSPANIKGTNPDGSIDKAASSGKEVSQAPNVANVTVGSLDYTDIPHSKIRKVTAEELLQSKQTIPHYYLTVDTCVDKLRGLLSQLNSLQKASGGQMISVNDFVIKAAALALKKVPRCNSSWTNDCIRQFNNVNISVAVQTENGLYVPIIKDADKKGLSRISEEVQHLAQKAKENSLKPEDYEGGTFIVSNFGGPFGIKHFCAIINPAQAGILAVGSAEERVMPGAGPGQFKFASFLSATLSCDHRVIDGATGAEWLKAFQSYIENPESMLL